MIVYSPVLSLEKFREAEERELLHKIGELNTHKIRADPIMLSRTLSSKKNHSERVLWMPSEVVAKLERLEDAGLVQSMRLDDIPCDNARTAFFLPQYADGSFIPSYPADIPKRELVAGIEEQFKKAGVPTSKASAFLIKRQLAFGGYTSWSHAFLRLDEVCKYSMPEPQMKKPVVKPDAPLPVELIPPAAVVKVREEKPAPKPLIPPEHYDGALAEQQLLILDTIREFNYNQVRADPQLLARSLKTRGTPVALEEVERVASELADYNLLKTSRDRLGQFYSSLEADIWGSRPEYNKKFFDQDDLENVKTVFKAVDIPLRQGARKLMHRQLVFGGYGGGISRASRELDELIRPKRVERDHRVQYIERLNNFPLD